LFPSHSSLVQNLICHRIDRHHQDSQHVNHHDKVGTTVVTAEAMAATKGHHNANHHHVKVEMEAIVEAIKDHLDQAAVMVVSVARAVDHDKVLVA